MCDGSESIQPYLTSTTLAFITGWMGQRGSNSISSHALPANPGPKEHIQGSLRVNEDHILFHKQIETFIGL